ncbi:hypothetical protein TrVE_jg11384 [Triparma verrucosa]|uniref:WW domain-containing protein n=1 Tax=Triparma verrucosa TaxID=1606542 RepID=A0A9W7EM58_9STRA|nr:hypothetical protein TrVE_jg11384 [Triparma verrucosa]
MASESDPNPEGGFTKMDRDDVELTRESSLAFATRDMASASLAGFEPDCGRRHIYVDGKKERGKKFLSYKKASITNAQKHVGILKDTHDDGTKDTLVPFPLNAPLGAHNWNENYLLTRLLKKCFGTCLMQKPSVLEPYGIGLVLYFKFLKLMTVCFLFMSLALAPSILFYWMGSSTSDEDKALMISESALNALFFTTIGSLGAGAVSCMEGNYDQKFDLECPSGVFKSIEAHWGTPTGYCSCPAAQQPNEDGVCPGSKTYPAEASWGACTVDSDGEKEACWLSATKITKESCCAYDLVNPDPEEGESPDFTPDLTKVDISANPSCSSPSAQYIADGICLGQKNCTFTIDYNHTYTWDYNEKYDTVCDSEWDKTASNEDGLVCHRKLDDDVYDNGANFTSCPAKKDYNLIVVGLCAEEEMTVDFNGNEYTFVKEDLIQYIAYIDCFAIFVFLMAIQWMNQRELDAIDESDSMNCSPSDYTVMVTNLPTHDPGQLKGELIAHFESVLKANKTEEDEKLRVKGQDDKIVPEDLRVFDIQFSLNNRQLIRWKKQRGLTARLKDKLENEVYILNQWGKFKGKLKAKLELRHHLLQTKFDRANKKLEAIERSVASGKFKEHAKNAFITFHTEAACVRCKKIYPDLGFLHRMTMWKRHRMGGKHKLVVKSAPEPSEIIWENLGIGFFSRVIRLTFTSIFTLAMLAASFILIYRGRVAQEEAALKYPEAECSNYIIEPVPNKNITLEDLEYVTPLSVQYDINWEHYNQTLGNTGKLECFCKGLLVDSNYALNGMLEFNFEDATTGNNEQWCKSWFESYSYISALKLAAVLGVVGTNVVLKLVLKKLINIEGPGDKTSMITSLTLKLFLASFVNTAFLTLLINGNIDVFMGGQDKTDTLENINNFGLLGGGYDDFGEVWYLEIGVPIIMTMIINMISPHVSTFVTWILKRYKQWKDRSFSSDHGITKMVTQNDLELMYTGPEFLLYERYASLLNTLFVCLMFSSGMPVLIPICFLTFWSYYWVDKFMLFRFFSLPPRLDASLAQQVSSILPYSVLLHLSFGMWMMSNDDFFTTASVELDTSALNATSVGVGGVSVDVRSLDISDTFGDNAFLGEVYDRFSHANNLASFVLFILLVVGIVWNRLVVKILRQSSGFLSVFSCLQTCLEGTNELEGNPPFLQAIETEMMQLQIGLGLLDDNIIEQYKTELERRERGRGVKEEDQREIKILESYNFEANQEYIKAFASDASSVMEYNSRKKTEIRESESISEKDLGVPDTMEEGLEDLGGQIDEKFNSVYSAMEKGVMDATHKIEVMAHGGEGGTKEVELVKDGNARDRAPTGPRRNAEKLREKKMERESLGGGEGGQGEGLGGDEVQVNVGGGGFGDESQALVVAGAEDAWEQRYDEESGHYFYENIITQERSWEAPAKFKPFEVNAAQL